MFLNTKSELKKTLTRILFANKEKEKDEFNYDSVDECDRILFKPGEKVLSLQEFITRKKHHFLSSKVFGIKLDNLIETVKLKQSEELR